METGLHTYGEHLPSTAMTSPASDTRQPPLKLLDFDVQYEWHTTA